MGHSEKAGSALERLVVMLERVLASSNANIESPSRRLIDRDTGKRREHDVLICWDHGHHQIITAIECRDRSRPVGVPDVEAFAKKCSATGVHSGVIVSSSGFRESARAKAIALSIKCMDINEVDRFDWIAPDAEITGYRRQFNSIHVSLIFHEEKPEILGAIFDANGKEINSEELISIIVSNIPHDDCSPDGTDKEYLKTLHIKTVDWFMRVGSGKLWKIDGIVAETSYKYHREYREKFHSYKYVGEGQSYSIGSAYAPLNGRNGRIVLRKNADESTSVYWVSDRHGDSN